MVCHSERSEESLKTRKNQAKNTSKTSLKIRKNQHKKINEKNLKFFEKSVDKSLFVCYSIRALRRWCSSVGRAADL